jgi:predicted molibdopterin-dependent oxidoreductase YjgC
MYKLLTGTVARLRNDLRDPALNLMRDRRLTMGKQHKARLTTPLVRDQGSLRPASWEEALDRAAEGFRRAIEKHGPQAFGIFSCSKTTNELNFLAQKFARVVIGTNNVDSCNRT